jgi:uncharacterized membrane protein
MKKRLIKLIITYYSQKSKYFSKIRQITAKKQETYNINLLFYVNLLTFFNIFIIMSYQVTLLNEHRHSVFADKNGGKNV